MRCPFCSAVETKVIDSRLAGDGQQVRRRRQCIECNERFTTYETVDLDLPHIIKRDGKRDAFNIDKLRAGILRALEKRPVGADAVEVMINRLLRRVRAQGDREMPSRIMGEWVMEELREIDQVAYVRFASVYRSFEDVNAFREEVERLQKQLSPEMIERQLSLLPDDDKT